MSLLYMMPIVEPLVMRWNYEHFKEKSLTDLMKCIWTYSDNHGKRCKVCRVYKRWDITTLRNKWFSCYIPLEPLLQKLKTRDPKYAYIAHLPSGFSLYLRPVIRNEASTSTAARPCQNNSTETTAQRLIRLHTEKKARKRLLLIENI